MKINVLLLLSLVSVQVTKADFAPAVYSNEGKVEAVMYYPGKDGNLTSTQKTVNEFAQFLVSPSKLDVLETLLPDQVEAVKKAVVAKIVANPEAKVVDNKLVTITKDDVVRTAGLFLRKLGGIAVRNEDVTQPFPRQIGAVNAAYRAANATARSLAVGYAYGKITNLLAEQAEKRGLSVPEFVKQQTVLFSVAKYVAAQGLVFGLCKTCGATENLAKGFFSAAVGQFRKP